MNMKVFWFFIGIPTLANAYPDISMQIKQEKYVKPYLYKLSIRIETTSTSTSNLISYLGDLDKKIRSLKIKYEGGNFNIVKNCFFVKNHYTCEGYKAIDSYNFYMKSPKTQEEIFNALNGINYDIVYSGFIIPKDQENKIKDTLKFDLANKSIKYAQEFSKIYNKTCFVKNIYYETHSNPAPIFRQVINMQTPIPSNSNKTISMSANLKISCK